jgi:hypothetical protein
LGQRKGAEAEENESGKSCRQIRYSHLDYGSSAEPSGTPEPRDGRSFDKDNATPYIGTRRSRH